MLSSPTDSSIPVTSTQSRRLYCSLLKHRRSSVVILVASASLTERDTTSSDSIFTIFSDRFFRSAEMTSYKNTSFKISETAAPRCFLQGFLVEKVEEDIYLRLELLFLHALTALIKWEKNRLTVDSSWSDNRIGS